MVERARRSFERRRGFRRASDTEFRRLVEDHLDDSAERNEIIDGRFDRIESQIDKIDAKVNYIFGGLAVVVVVVPIIVNLLNNHS